LETTILGGVQMAGIRAASTRPDAYEPYLKGRFFWNKRTEANLARAVDLFGEAIAADPNYAPAHAGLADAYAVLGTYGAREPRKVMPLAMESAERARALDSTLAEPHATLGLIEAVFAHNWEKSEAAFARALTLDPTYVTAHQWRAITLLIPTGRAADALASMERARAIDPLSAVVGMTTGVVRAIGGDSGAAIAAFCDVLKLEPGFGMAHFFLGQTLMDEGRHAEAKESFERAIALTGGSAEMLSGLAQAKARLGEGDAASADLETLMSRRAARYTPASQVALVHIALGQHDAAMEWLQVARRDDDPELIYLTAKRAYAPLRSRPDFADLVRSVRLSP
ncbi:MAG: tetratricopeptide repeat protein, partial [Gemmatimonadota bacterium]|nr:tetratricopeptide repeat protein [Gemmatimonadota bacterium]